MFQTVKCERRTVKECGGGVKPWPGASETRVVWQTEENSSPPTPDAHISTADSACLTGWVQTEPRKRSSCAVSRCQQRVRSLWIRPAGLVQPSTPPPREPPPVRGHVLKTAANFHFCSALPSQTLVLNSGSFLSHLVCCTASFFFLILFGTISRPISLCLIELLIGIIHRSSGEMIQWCVLKSALQQMSGH